MLLPYPRKEGPPLSAVVQTCAVDIKDGDGGVPGRPLRLTAVRIILVVAEIGGRRWLGLQILHGSNAVPPASATLLAPLRIVLRAVLRPPWFRRTGARLLRARLGRLRSLIRRGWGGCRDLRRLLR